VLDVFAAVIVSDAVGWRKPRPDIFRTALATTGANAARTLFVGDRADIDVEGAHRAGMDAAWLNPARDPLPEGIAPPEYEIRDLADLESILSLK
jgi:putative hydrolase of the HAD superfamily